MKFKDIDALVGHIPFIERPNAKYLYDLILHDEIVSILELGIAHGTATCFMAAALQELGRGHIVSVDLIEAEPLFDPKPEDMLARVGLSQFVEIVRTKTGYNWFLHDNIQRNTIDGICREEYDLCIIDGAKNWTSEGAAFFFADKLLKPGGWIIFDDYSWSYGFVQTHQGRQATDGIAHRSLSEAELNTAHIHDVFELLVVQHPSYGNFVRLEPQWALAQKVGGAAKTYTVIERNLETYQDVIVKAVRKAQRLLRRAKD